MSGDTPTEPRAPRRSLWLLPLTILACASAAAFIAPYALDLTRPAHRGLGFWDVFQNISAADAGQALGGISEVIAAILGIVITVASIIVQLAATRYTPRVTEMFFRDRTNLVVMGLFVVSAVFSLWVNFSVRAGDDGSTSVPFAPHVGVLATMALLTLCLLTMAPYFAYVFSFLEPSHIVGRIQSVGLRVALSTPRHESDAEVDARGLQALSSLEQLADVSMNAIEKKDKGIASSTIDAISELVVTYVPEKHRLDPRWFEIRGELRKDPDFVSMNPEWLEKLSESRTWLEYKALRQFLMVYREALSEMPDIVNRIAIASRYIGQAAIAADDHAALGVVIKFFNTYMRRALNARDVAAAYNNLNQYRHLGEELLRAGWNDEVVAVANHFKYYAQTAQAMKLAFVTETVAYDLCELNELAFDLEAETRDELLRVFLEVDKEAEVESQEISLRGVRKAQIKLATYYLEKDADRLARRIFRDMRDERPDRLRSIKAELLSVTSSEFWEINDRGGVFEYLQPDRRERIHQFFAWFPALSLAPSKALDETSPG